MDRLATSTNGEPKGPHYVPRRNLLQRDILLHTRLTQRTRTHSVREATVVHTRVGA